MKIKSWVKYFIFSVLLFSFSVLGQHIFQSVRMDNEQTLNFKPYFYNLLMIVFYGGVGILLGLEYLIKEITKKGVWKINLPKLLLVGAPSLYFSLNIFIYYFNVPFILNHLSFPLVLFSQSDTSYIAVFQVMLGYIITTSFYKVNKAKFT